LAVVFVNAIPFFATISDHLKFTTAEHIVSRKKSNNSLQASNTMQALYAARDFQVKTMLMDGGSFPYHDLASAGIILNTTSANEHVPKIERQIRVIKGVYGLQTYPSIQGNPTHHAHRSSYFFHPLVNAFHPKAASHRI
jgi:hypothetical protein